MDFFLKYLRETLEAINKLIAQDIFIVNCKRVRICNKIKSSNRSKINFIWRSLEFLREEGFLKVIGRNSAKQYKIILPTPFTIEVYLDYIKKKKKLLQEYKNREKG